MSSTMNAKPTIAPANQRNTKEKKEHRLVVAPPSLRPGGIMPPPQSKGGQDGTGAGGEEFTFNSLVSTISSLSPWAEPPAATEDGEEVGQVVRPEDALEFFQKQTMNMDKEALLARVAEAAAREADAVTKLGQLTFKLAAKEKLMDDLRAGLVSAGRAVTEAQQEADEVKKAVAQQEAALAAKYGTTIDVLKRLGEVTAKSDAKESALEQAKADLAAAKRAQSGLDSELQAVKRDAAAREAELVSHMALAKKSAISREVELSTALAAAKAAAQKALAAASAARAVRTNEIIDVLSAKESQVEGLMTALDAVKVQNEIIEDEGVDEEDKEEIGEKDELIKNLLRDLIAAIYGAQGAMSMYSVEEIEKLRSSVKQASSELEVMRHNVNVTNYSVAQIEELKRDLAARERELGITLAQGGSGAPSAATLKELDQMRQAVVARDREIATLRAAIEKGAAQAKAPESEISKLSKEDLVKSLKAMDGQLDALRAELATARASSYAAAQQEAASTPKSRPGHAASEAELEEARATIVARDQLLDGLKQDFQAARKALAQAEKDKEALKKELREREASLQAELSGVKGSLRASEAAHQQQLTAKDSSTESLRADLNAARRAIAAAEADIVATKKAAAAREAQLHAELGASKTSYEVLKLAAYAVKAQPDPGQMAHHAGANGGAMSTAPPMIYRPGELSAQLAAREAHIESLKAELAAVRRAVQAAEEEAQARREAMAALEHDLGAELSAAKAAHEAAELAAAELATNAAANAQNASNMMSMLSEQLSQERELRREAELELRAERDANPERPHASAAAIIAAEAAALRRASRQGGVLGGLLKSVVAGVAAGVATTVALGGSELSKKAQGRRPTPVVAAVVAPAVVHTAEA